MANHQVMLLAPQDIRACYFAEIFDLINVQARNKLSLCMRRIQKKKQIIEMDAKIPSVQMGYEIDNDVRRKWSWMESMIM
jgi:hypothetical protein